MALSRGSARPSWASSDHLRKRHQAAFRSFSEPPTIRRGRSGAHLVDRRPATQRRHPAKRARQCDRRPAKQRHQPTRRARQCDRRPAKQRHQPTRRGRQSSRRPAKQRRQSTRRGRQCSRRPAKQRAQPREPTRSRSRLFPPPAQAILRGWWRLSRLSEPKPGKINTALTSDANRENTQKRGRAIKPKRLLTSKTSRNRTGTADRPKPPDSQPSRNKLSNRTIGKSRSAANGSSAPRSRANRPKGMIEGSRAPDPSTMTREGATSADRRDGLHQHPEQPGSQPGLPNRGIQR